MLSGSVHAQWKRACAVAARMLSGSAHADRRVACCSVARTALVTARVWSRRCCVCAQFYDGDWKNDRREGMGSTRYASGDKYEGGWRAGQREGRGRAMYANRDRYEGEWKSDKKQGFGARASSCCSKRSPARDCISCRLGAACQHASMHCAAPGAMPDEQQPSFEFQPPLHQCFTPSLRNAYPLRYACAPPADAFWVASGEVYEGQWMAHPC